MKILHISDTHGQHHELHNLPEADVLVHSGDFTENGTEKEAIDFINWFCDLKYKIKVFICGNHDDCLYKATVEGLDSNVHYLCNSGIEIDGIKFYGVPMFTNDCLTEQQACNYRNIPSDIDVLITHSPAYGILDQEDNIHYGSQELLSRLSSLNLKAHLFGHVHGQQGLRSIDGKIFSNGVITELNGMNKYNTIIIK